MVNYYFTKQHPSSKPKRDVLLFAMYKILLENGDTADKGKLLSLTVNSVYNT